MTFAVIYAYSGFKALEDGRTKIKEEDMAQLSKAVILQIHDSPARGKYSKKTVTASKKTPFYCIENLSTKRKSIIPAYTVLRLMTEKDEEELEEKLSASTNSNKSSSSSSSSASDDKITGKKRTSDASSSDDSDHAPAAKKKAPAPPSSTP